MKKTMKSGTKEESLKLVDIIEQLMHSIRRKKKRPGNDILDGPQ